MFLSNEECNLPSATLFVCAGFTGIDSAYEPPVNPDLTLKAGELTLDECVLEVVKLLKDKVTLAGVGKGGWGGGVDLYLVNSYVYVLFCMPRAKEILKYVPSAFHFYVSQNAKK